jgi:hypothetical protein
LAELFCPGWLRPGFRFFKQFAFQLAAFPISTLAVDRWGSFAFSLLGRSPGAGKSTLTYFDWV